MTLSAALTTRLLEDESPLGLEPGLDKCPIDRSELSTQVHGAFGGRSHPQVTPSTQPRIPRPRLFLRPRCRLHSLAFLPKAVNRTAACSLEELRRCRRIRDEGVRDHHRLVDRQITRSDSLVELGLVPQLPSGAQRVVRAALGLAADSCQPGPGRPIALSLVNLAFDGSGGHQGAGRAAQALRLCPLLGGSLRREAGELAGLEIGNDLLQEGNDVRDARSGIDPPLGVARPSRRPARRLVHVFDSTDKVCHSACDSCASRPQSGGTV